MWYVVINVHINVSGFLLSFNKRRFFEIFLCKRWLFVPGSMIYIIFGTAGQHAFVLLLFLLMFCLMFWFFRLRLCKTHCPICYDITIQEFIMTAYPFQAICYSRSDSQSKIVSLVYFWKTLLRWKSKTFHSLYSLLSNK